MANNPALLKVWATATLPASTNVVGHHIETTCGVSYTRSGLVELMAALDVRVAQARTRTLAPRSRRPDRFRRPARETQQRPGGRRSDRLRRRRPPHPSDPAGGCRDAARRRHRGSRSIGPGPDEHPRCDRSGDGRDADERSPVRRRRQHHRSSDVHRSRISDDAPDPRPSRRRPLPSCPCRPGLDEAARPAHRPDLPSSPQLHRAALGGDARERDAQSVLHDVQGFCGRCSDVLDT